jgi:hypothetical protein
MFTPGLLELGALVAAQLLPSRRPAPYRPYADLLQERGLLVHLERMCIVGTAGTAIPGPPRIRHVELLQCLVELGAPDLIEVECAQERETREWRSLAWRKGHNGLSFRALGADHIAPRHREASQETASACSAVHVTAGHNAFRGSGPGHNHAFDHLWPEWVVLIAGTTGSAYVPFAPPTVHTGATAAIDEPTRAGIIVGNMRSFS